jgi:ribonuclease Z
MVKLYCLGTGGFVASARRDNTSFIVRTGDSAILIDCPGSVIQKVKKMEMDPCEVKTILITHVHADHVYGLPSLVHSLMMEDMHVKLVGSRESVAFCRDLLHLFGLLQNKIKYRLDFISLEAGGSCELSPGIVCHTCDVPHSSSSLAFRLKFEQEGIDLVYSGDSPIHTPLFQWAEKSNYLIHDCGAPSRVFDLDPHLKTMHTHSLDLGKHAHKAGIKCLILCHIFTEMDFEDNELEEEIRQNYDGRLVIPEDFQKVQLA